jgi:hypothetical protein
MKRTVTKSTMQKLRDFVVPKPPTTLIDIVEDT